ncbi:MAG: hypothetical protein JWM31_1883 [Solirubrobacterales bacterium]|nr:hypothetical protein [Solirubrobacterales bacterium]
MSTRPMTPSPAPTSSRRARRLAASALIAVALPIAGCGGGSSSGGSADTDPASVVPAGAAFYGEATVRPEGDQKASVETLAKKIARTDDPAAKIIAALDQQLKADGQTFAKDIDPWLGKKIGVAITGLRGTSNPDYAIVLAATDEKKAIAALKNGAKNVVQRKYKDVTYEYSKDQQQAAVAGKGTLAIGTEAAIKSVIDVEKGADSLAGSDKLAKARKSVTSDRLGFLYADPVSIIDLVANASPQLGSQAAPLKSLLGGSKASAVGAALTAAADAIRVETTVDGATGRPSGDAAATLAALPAGSVVGLGLGDVGQSLQKGLGQVGQLGGIYTSLLGQFKAITGLDLQQDVLSWMGKGGLFLRAKGLADVGGALVVDTSDERKTTAFIDSTRQLITRFGAGSGLSLKPYSAAGAKGFQIQTGSVPFPIIVATGGGKFVVAVGTRSVEQALKPTGTLADDAQFKATAAKLGTKPEAYVDLSTIVGFLSLAAGDNTGFKTAKPYLEAFTALAAGSEQSGGTRKSSLVVGVK